MLQIMFAKLGISGIKLRIALSAVYGALHELLYAIAYKLAHLFQRAFGHPCPSQSIIGAGGKIAQCVEQCAV